MPDQTPALKRSRLAHGGFIAALILAALAVLAGPLHRFGVIEFPIARHLLAAATIGGPVVALICLAAAIRTRPGHGRRGRTQALVGLLLSLLVAGFLWSLVRTAMSLPMIHDITTDPENPPPFAAVLALREPGTNDPTYGGVELARQQKAAYPDIAPLVLPVPPEAAFDRALETAQALGWQIVVSDRVAGRIEAVDTTLWFGFKDDVVIRISHSPEGAVVDLRSASRIGLSDLGANAMRIRRFFAVFKDIG